MKLLKYLKHQLTNIKQILCYVYTTLRCIHNIHTNITEGFKLLSILPYVQI